MLAIHHLNKYVDVIKHDKVYKRVRIKKASNYKTAEKAALDYYEKLGYIMLFRYVGYVTDAHEFEGVLVVYEC